MLITFHCAVLTLPVHKIFIAMLVVYNTIYTFKMWTFHNFAVGEAPKLEKKVDKSMF